MSNSRVRDRQTKAGRQTALEWQAQFKVIERAVTMLCQMLCHHRSESNLSSCSEKGFSPRFLNWAEGVMLHSLQAWYCKLHLTTKKAAKVTTERGQDIKFTTGPIRETARLPSGPGRALEMRRDREMEDEEGGGFYTKWVGQSRESAGERGRQRCYRRRDKWKTIDVSSMMWEKSTREAGGSETGDWMDISKGIFREVDSVCDELKTHWSGEVQHSGVELQQMRSLNWH